MVYAKNDQGRVMPETRRWGIGENEPWSFFTSSRGFFLKTRPVISPLPIHGPGRQLCSFPIVQEK